MKEVSPRQLGLTVMVDQGDIEGRDFERFDAYIVLREGYVVTDPDGQIDQLEVCRAIVNAISSEIGARVAHLKSYDNISISGLGIHHEIEITENPGEFEGLYGDYPEGFTPWKLSFYCLFAQWPIVEARGEEIEYPSELMIYAPEKIRKEVERDRWAARFPNANLELVSGPEEDEEPKLPNDPFKPDQPSESDKEEDEGEKPSFN